MDLEANSRHSVLERMLIDGNAEPTDLPLSLLEDITDSFSLDREIGRGGFAVVYKGIVRERMVAVKKLFRTFDIVHENKFHKEIECLMNAKHKNIVRFLGYCAEAHGIAADWEGNFVMANLLNWLLCFEYVPNGNLQKYITDASGGLEWRVRFRIIKGICEGLHYFHINRILHLDLKPANILLDSHMEPKIADFCLSRYLNEEKTHDTTKHLFGTPGYMAPEFYGGKITFASDIYSLGVIIMEILTGLKGYPEDENVTESWMIRLEGDMQLEQVRVCTKIGIECMESDPKKRPVARCIIDMLDKTASADDAGMSSSSTGPQASLFEQQSNQEKIGKLEESLSQEDIKEHPATEDVEEHLENDHSQEGQGYTHNWSSWKAQDTEQNDGSQGTSMLNPRYRVRDKLSFLKIFKQDARRKFVGGIRIFTKREIMKITKICSASLLRVGADFKLYIGILPDLITTVAVKIYSGIQDGGRMDEFVKELEIQTQMIHKNIIKLVGYCLEADVRISVHEFAANGSLYTVLHYNKDQMLPLDLRLDIAIGSAEGLRYMHSGGIRHGDVCSDTILLDEILTPKISDFDCSQVLTVDECVTDRIIGRQGYIDTAYLQTCLPALKNDVYSFGMVLVELVTRKKIDCNDIYGLIKEYLKCYVIEKSGRAIFDTKITAEDEILVLEEIGKLAIECLKEDIQERPDMTEVSERLVMIRRDRRLWKAHNRS